MSMLHININIYWWISCLKLCMLRMIFDKNNKENVSSPCKRNIMGRDIKQRNKHAFHICFGLMFTCWYNYAALCVFILHIRAKHLNTVECIYKDYTAKFFSYQVHDHYFETQNIISKNLNKDYRCAYYFDIWWSMKHLRVNRMTDEKAQEILKSVNAKYWNNNEKSIKVSSYWYNEFENV